MYLFILGRRKNIYDIKLNLVICQNLFSLILCSLSHLAQFYDYYIFALYLKEIF